MDMSSKGLVWAEMRASDQWKLQPGSDEPGSDTMWVFTRDLNSISVCVCVRTPMEQQEFVNGDLEREIDESLFRCVDKCIRD